LSSFWRRKHFADTCPVILLLYRLGAVPTPPRPFLQTARAITQKHGSIHPHKESQSNISSGPDRFTSFFRPRVYFSCSSPIHAGRNLLISFSLTVPRVPPSRSEDGESDDEGGTSAPRRPSDSFLSFVPGLTCPYLFF